MAHDASVISRNCRPGTVLCTACIFHKTIHICSSRVCWSLLQKYFDGPGTGRAKRVRINSFFFQPVPAAKNDPVPKFQKYFGPLISTPASVPTSTRSYPFSPCMLFTSPASHNGPAQTPKTTTTHGVDYDPQCTVLHWPAATPSCLIRRIISGHSSHSPDNLLLVCKISLIDWMCPPDQK